MRKPKYVGKAPWLYRTSTRLVRGGWRGSTFLFKRLSRQGLFDCVARFPLTRSLFIEAPLYTDNVWDEDSLRSYDAGFITALVQEAESLPRPLRFVDCGASFGLFALHIASAFPDLERIVAFEPNPEMFEILVANLRQLGAHAEAHNSAVSDWRGFGELRAPENDSSPDARYLDKASTGPIAVTTLEDLTGISGGGLIVKIDVEGGEINVLRGALGLLERTEQFVVAFEAHPKVFERTRVDPLECARLVNSVRRCTIRVAEFPLVELCLDTPFFDQVPERKVCNIVCRSQA